jgi:hypothetical protein
MQLNINNYFKLLENIYLDIIIEGHIQTHKW